MGKFVDGFLNLLKINDDEEYDDYEYDDDYDDDYEEEIEEPAKPSYKEKSYAQAEAREEAPRREAPKKTYRDVADDYDDMPAAVSKKPSRPAKNQKVVPMRRTNTGSNMEVCVVKPANVEDAKEITETLLQGKAVVLNLEGLHVDMAQRIIDFSSGSCYAISGNLQKISSYIFIITPSSVDISGDIPDLLNGGFDVSTL